MSILYVDPAFSGSINGDTVTWNSAAASRLAVTFGTNGFTTPDAAIAAAASGDTILLAAVSINLTAGLTLSKALTVIGYGATLNMLGTFTISGVAARFRDVAFSQSVGAVNSMVRVISGASAGFTHCSFTISTTAAHAVEVSGAGSAGVLSGCSFTNIGDAKIVGTNSGAAGIFARTPMPVGGSSGRAGNHYRLKASIEAPAEYRTTANDQKIAWVAVDEAYCSIEPLRAHEHTLAALAGADATHRIEFPGGLTITAAYRCVVRERTYLFSAPMTTDSRENKLAFKALERAA